ncbi:glycoside hydrolase family 5 protein [Thermus filiformis]|uniref:glycoside hydrolase family 5 protein n=1 Tax=Thermus filiformis TaxID=276 RepID=UPI000531627D|nr:glycoside hydrolase family 5 protein [Thermus filiformis]
MRKAVYVALTGLFLAACGGETNTGGGGGTKDDIFTLSRLLGRGVNFGNALEAPREGEWGVTLEEGFFDLVKQAGFTHIRLPVSWTYHALREPPYTIDPAFFARVDWALEQATRRGLRVVLNLHHYDELHQDPQRERARFLALWEQIASRYKDQPDLVYFEVLNEPHGVFNDQPELWNDLFAEALVVIRRTNPTRPVLVGPVEWNRLERLSDLRLPQDPRLIVTFHFYDPFAFTHQGAPWVSPTPPVGTPWTGDRPVWAWGWEDWSWDTGRELVTGGVRVTYERGWAGLRLHARVKAEGYTHLAFRTDREVRLRLRCNEREDAALLLHAPGGQEVEVALRSCGAGEGVWDLVFQNASPDPQPSFLLEGVRLKGPRGELALVTDERGAVRQAMGYAASWSQSRGYPVYLGEFGSYEKADLDSRVRWTRAVREEAEGAGLSWAYWEFAAGFGIYDLSTRAWREPLLRALIPEAP